MRKLFIIIAAMALAMSANAQGISLGSGLTKEFHLFDFEFNTSRLEGGINIGQSGSFSEYARFAIGANILVGGFYLDFLKADAQHKYDSTLTDAQYNDNESFSINVGYQIPLLRWLRIMPLMGYSQTNDGITDGSSLSVSADEDSVTWYHRYEVTPGSRKHYFNYGGGLSIQPCKWFSVNLVATRNALYGGFGLNILEFANK
ncbi:MAG: hypothetical protein J5835_02430 [Bacteroidales bacterium]|nr:hypothetical protein [Bacteroidales bacterium]